jgi:dolichyl-phosphate beta-glucosyltransferase
MKNARAGILIVIPAYHESKRLPSLFIDIAAHLKKPGALDGVDFLVVDDGSGAEEVDKVRSLIAAQGLGEAVSLLPLSVNQGKGGAVKAGFIQGLSSGYEYLGFMDADGSVSAAALEEVVEYLRRRSHLPLAGVAASRVRMLGRRIARSWPRHYVSRVFATFVAFCFGVQMHDSQCGLKIFKSDVLKKYLDAPTDHRWVWDTELVMAMLHGGETVHEVPIDWREMGDSKMLFLHDPFVMAARLIGFRRRLSGPRR